MSSEVKQGEKGTTSQENVGNFRKPVMFWSENERDAFRRNRVVQIRCSMILDDLHNEQKTARKSIRYEAHKFRQKSGKYYRHPGVASTQDSQVSYASPPDTARITNQSKMESRNKYYTDLDEEDTTVKEDVQLPKMKGIITRGRKPVVTFSVNDKARDNFNQIKTIKDIDTNGSDCKYEHGRETMSSLRALPKRSLSAVHFRESPDNRWLRRQQSAVFIRPTTRSALNPDTSGHVKGLITYRNTRSDTFFDKSKAAYQLRYELRRQARLRKSGVKQKVITLKDVLDAEREKYVKSRGKIKEYIERLDSEKIFKPLIINRWTAGEIEKQLKV